MLNYGFQSIDKKDIEYVIRALKSSFLTTGPYVKQFERLFAKKVGAKYAVAVSNATAGLHIAVQAASLPINSEGITSANTFLASSNAFLYNNLKPVFADIDKKTYNVDPDEISKKISKKTSIIIPVHFAGQPCDMGKIKEIIKDKKIIIIEDAAHAVGSKYKNGKMVGSCYYSAMTVFSFHPVKTITTGEGGMITTNSKAYYETLLMLRSHGMTKDPQLLNKNPGPWYYEMHSLGFNYRLTDIQSALGISQLSKLDKFIKRRREIVRKYNQAFKNTPWLTVPYEEKGIFSAFHLYVLLIDFNKIKKSRKKVMEILFKKGIGTQVHYIPVYLQPYYTKNFGFKQGMCPNAEDYYKKCLSIPLFPSMKNSDVSKVIKSIKELNTLP
ncbi:MAG: UDP-4-amino-4,6-dideoxy-N-acetyl-beta-L-altrosamine transaminase [Patescibacteria group bacterium]|jgi:UDP-4-amino-4,6-dideoxy-N-acetyl-beta-L-altrosamine transaminase